jgi:hypothetical protein
MNGPAPARALPLRCSKHFAALPPPYRYLPERLAEVLRQICGRRRCGRVERGAGLADCASDLDLVVTVTDGSGDAFSARLPHLRGQGRWGPPAC